MPTKFGKNLKELRARSAMTQAQVAESAQIHKRHYQAIEACEKVPSVLIAARLRKTLDCTWEELTKGLTK
jgi:DNA-binding XRE family transcriptional regulator